MARRDYDPYKINHKRYYKLSEILLYFIVGFVFAVVGVFMLVMMIKLIVEQIKAHSFDVSVIFLALMGIVFSCCGGGAIYTAGKDVYNCAMLRLTKKNGEEGYAEIIDWRVISKGRSHDEPECLKKKYYGCELLYQQDGEKKVFKTDTIYDENETQYLKTLKQIKIKIYKDYVAIDEEFPDEIYWRDPKTGLDKYSFD